VLIEYLTFNYIFTYFWIVIWLSYQLFIHACSEANFRENYFSAIFSEFQLFSVKHPDRLGLQSGLMWSCRLLVWQVDHLDALVTHPNSILIGFYPSLSFSAIRTALHFFFLFLSCCVRFSRGLLLRFWYSLHISSHSVGNLFVFLYSFKFLCFSE
jgi:hypothetical protein